MRVFRSLDEWTGHEPSVTTIGVFDGVHLAHQALLGRVCERARAERARSVAITFEPHPVAVLAPAKAPKALTPLPIKLELLERSGIDAALVLPFTEELSRWTPEQFVQRVLVEALHVSGVVIGENFRFGHKQAGTPQLLRDQGLQLHFTTEVLPRISVRGYVVSSSQIRRLLEAGRLSMANRLLGRAFTIRGEIVPGLGIGHTQTVPTFNLGPYPGQLPSRGVYVSSARLARGGNSGPHDIGRALRSVTNVGVRPTFGERDLGVETHLLEPWQGSAPAQLEISFLYRLRDELKFDSAEQLKAQIQRDIVRAQNYFRRVQAWVEGSNPQIGAAAGRGLR